MNKSAILDKLAEYCVILAAALAWVVNLSRFLVTQYQLDQNLLKMLLFSAVILFLFSFKKIFAYAAILIVSLLALIAAFVQLSTGAVLRYYYSISNNGGLELQSGRMISVFLTLIAVLCCLIVFFAAKNRFSLLAVGVLGVLVVFASSLLGYGYSLVSLLVFLSACTFLYIRSGLLGSEKKAHANGLRPGMIVLPIALCLIAAIGSQLSFNYFHSIFADKPEITFSNVFTQISDMLGFSRTGFGDYDANYKLGRSISYDNTLIFEVKADGPFYLKGRVYDNYTGKSWQDSTFDNNAINANLMSPSGFIGFSSQFYSDIATGNGGAYPGLRMRNLQITVKSAGLDYLLIAPDTINITTQQTLGTPVTRDFPDLKLTDALPVGDSYTVSYIDLNLNSALPPHIPAYGPGIDGGNQDTFPSNDGSENQSQIETGDADYSDIQADLQLGSTVTQRTRDLAAKITAGCDTEVEKANAIKTWLDKNCTYTLNPRQAPAHQDFVDFFLFDSQQGYCEHFASAMTVLLRAVGVPARYVEGYISPIPNSDGVYDVTNQQTHAWVEFFTPTYGFITADPTPTSSVSGGTTASSSSSAPASSSSQPSSSVPSSSSPSSSSSTVLSSGGSSAVTAGRAPQGGFIAVAAVLAVVVLLALLYGGSAALRAVRFRLIARRPREEQALLYYNSFVTSMQHLGFVRAPSATPYEYADSVRGKIHFDPVDFDTVTRIYVEARFGKKDISDGELDELRGFQRAFLKNCRSFAGTVPFILKYPFL